MCAYGAVIHGYQNETIEIAVNEQRKYGSVFNHPHEVTVELAEKLTEMIDFASWAVFAKNGSDLTTWSIRVAREYTKRPLIVKAEGAYHGWMRGVIQVWEGELILIEWISLSFNGMILTNLKIFLEKVDQIAGNSYSISSCSICSSIMPNNDFWATVQELCTSNGSLLILDDVRAGWRLHEGGLIAFSVSLRICPFIQKP